MCTNGILSFRSSFGYADFPDISENQYILIAPFGSDTDITRFGNIFYRTLNASEHPSNLQEIISDAFSISNFELRQVFVATYDQVAPYSGGGVSL